MHLQAVLIRDPMLLMFGQYRIGTTENLSNTEGSGERILCFQVFGGSSVSVFKEPSSLNMEADNPLKAWKWRAPLLNLHIIEVLSGSNNFIHWICVVWSIALEFIYPSGLLSNVFEGISEEASKFFFFALSLLQLLEFPRDSSIPPSLSYKFHYCV